MVSKEFSENVRVGDVITVRNALVEYMVIDRTFKTFDEALKYATQQLPVIEEYDGQEFELDTQKWDMRYLNVQKAALRFNFSQPRIDHLKDVIASVIPAETTGANSGKAGTPPLTPQKKTSRRTGRTVVGVTEHQPERKPVHSPQQQPIRRVSPSGKTGRTVVSETEYPADDKRELKGHIGYKGFDGASALIWGGVVVATVGLATVEPMAIGAGVAIADAGYAVKASRQNKGLNKSSASIVGGVAVAAVGLATVEPIAIGAGAAIAGVGCAAKAFSRQE